MTDDTIYRQAAIDTAVFECGEWTGLAKEISKQLRQLPSAQPERLTDDDFETIRIHLNAYKEKLCNQHRWREAEEYQEIIDRLMSFASAQPEIIRCKDCKYAHLTVSGECKHCDAWTDDDGYPMEIYEDGDFFCGHAERRTDEAD